MARHEKKYGALQKVELEAVGGIDPNQQLIKAAGGAGAIRRHRSPFLVVPLEALEGCRAIDPTTELAAKCCRWRLWKVIAPSIRYWKVPPFI